MPLLVFPVVAAGALARLSLRTIDLAGYPAEGIRRSQALHADGWHDMHLHARVAGDAD